MTFVYDPDDAPESSREFIGILEASVKVDNADEADRAGFGDSYRNYMESSGRDPNNTPVWFLRARALDVAREDGEPFYVTDLLVLKDKRGEWLGRGQAPSQVAQRFLELGYSASYLSVGKSNSAVGKAFRFRSMRLDLGRNFSKQVRLWPEELIEDPSSVKVTRVVSVPGSPAEPPAPQEADEETIKKIVSALDGIPTDRVFQVVINHPELKNVANVLGQDFVYAATTGLLSDLLVKAGYMTVDNNILHKAQS